MTPKFACRCLVLPSLLMLPLTARPQALMPETQKPIFTAATEKRAHDLLKQMTPEEKIGQMEQLFVFQPDPAIDERIRAGRLGSALFVTDPATINKMQHLAVENTRLHIPLIFGFDVIHGFRTIFPVPIAMASSWDPAAVETAQGVAASEARAVGIDWAFAPMLDIARDPRWGRIVEGAGEDPYLGAAIARAQVRGFQGPAIGTADRVLACAKHFAGYGAAEAGRDYDASYISDVQLQNVYLAPFHAAVQEGVGSLMSAYMDLNDVPATGNAFLLHDTLRQSWGFKGFVVSDADAVKSLEKHGFAADAADAGLRAAKAGVNMEMAIGTLAYDHLADAVKSKQMSAAEVDQAVLPILEAKIQLGLFEHPYVDEAQAEKTLTDPAHREVSLHVAERAAVLLQNKGNLLPLTASAYKSVAVVGPTGSDPMDLTGSWTFVQKNEETVTIPAALIKRFGGAASVAYEPGVQIQRHFPSMFDAIFQIKAEAMWTETERQQKFDAAVALAKKSDLVVLTMGEHQNMSGEAASRSSLELPGDQLKLLKAVAALGKPTVLLLQGGRPLNLTEVVDKVPAILDVWYLGTRGGEAITNLLFGDVAPGGHLPLAWPRNVGQVPINYAHNLTQDATKQGQRYWNEPSTPLFPFGFGLSYTMFKFSNLQVEPSSKIGAPLTVSVDVENTGGRAADEVAQIYVHQRSGRASRPVRELKGFQRISLAPREHRTLKFTLEDRDLMYWSGVEKTWVADASQFDLYAGDNADAELHGTFARVR